MRKIIVLICVTMLILVGCSASKPVDSIDVLWNDIGISAFGRQIQASFTYCGVKYTLFDENRTLFAEKSSLTYLGQLLTYGPLGNNCPIEVLGIPIYSSYDPAYCYYVGNSEVPSFIVSKTVNIWLSSDIIIEPLEEQKLSHCSIVGDEDECLSEISFENNSFSSFEEMIDLNKIVQDPELDWQVCYLKLYLAEIDSLYFYVSVYYYDDKYYVPLKADWDYTEKLAPLKEEIQKIISDNIK